MSADREPGIAGAVEHGAPIVRLSPPLDAPLSFPHNELVIGGNVEPADSAVQVTAQIADRRVAAQVEAGEFVAQIDTSDWPRGEHELVVEATDRAGRRGEARTRVHIDPYVPAPSNAADVRAAVAAGQTVMWCDEPDLGQVKEASLDLPVRGWAWCREGIEEVIVTIGGRTRQRATLGGARRDLVRLLGEPTLETAGFWLYIDPAAQPEGMQNVTVVAIGRDGRTVGLSGSLRFHPIGGAPPPLPPAPDAPTHTPLLADARESWRRLHEWLVPESTRGLLVHSEHQARYRWAAPLARGRTALDAACGSGYGALILAKAGAGSVAGVDRSPEAVMSARARVGERAEIWLADLEELPFADGSFDLVTSFETIEHVLDRDRALDELKRVLAPGGVLAISTPTRSMYSIDNPFHDHEYSLEEFSEALQTRFANVRILRQDAYLASLVAEVELAELDDVERRLEADLRKSARAEADPAYLVAIAGDGALPELPPATVLGEVAEVQRLIQAVWAWEERAMIAEADAQASRAQVSAAEGFALRAQHQVLESERLREQTEASIRGSLSWRLTRPLRWAKRALPGQ